MKYTYNLLLPFFLIFVIIGFSIWKQTMDDKSEGLENMEIDPIDDDVIIRNNHKVKRRKKSIKINEKISKKYRENLNIKGAFKKAGGALKNAGKKIKDGVEGAVNKVKDGVTKGFKQMTGFFKNILNTLKNFINAVKNFFLWLGDCVKCGVQKIKSLPQCMIWYLLDLIGKIIYIPFFLLFLFIRTITDVNVENMIWNVIETIDSYINSFAGFHLIYFPSEVIKKCYKCNIRSFPRM